MGMVNLSHLDDAYQTAETPQIGDLPDGKYQVRIDRASFKQSNATGDWGLNLEMVVLSGEHEGRYIFKWSNLEDTERLGYLKADLTTLGYSGLLSELEDNLAQLLDVKLEVQLKSKAGKTDPSKTYQNCYLNKNLGSQPAAQSTPQKRQGMAGVDTRNKFEDDPFASDLPDSDDLPF